MQSSSIRNQYQQSPMSKPVKPYSQVKYSSALELVQPSSLKLQLPAIQPVLVAILPPQDSASLLATYADMLNQETDLFYLFDSFHSVLNSLKQVYSLYTKQSPEKQAIYSSVTSSSRDTLNWSKVSGLISNVNTQWTGMKHLKTLDRNPSSHQDSFFNNNSHSQHMSSNQQFTLQSNASAIIDKLKREIGDLNEEHKRKDIRNLQGMQGVQIQLFTPEVLQESMIAPEKQILSIYQLQNKYYKCHLGFCVIQMKQENNDVNILKLYFAKYHRKNQNYFNMILLVIKHILKDLNANKIKIKVNSSQGQLIKLYFDVGFKLITQNQIVGDLKIVNLSLQKKDFNENYQMQLKKSYL